MAMLNLSVYCYKLALVLALGGLWPAPAPHPFHVSATEINHNAAAKTLEISSRVFIDDFELALSKRFNTKADLSSPSRHAAMDALVKKYFEASLSLNANGRPAALTYLGFEKEGEAVNVYIEVTGIPALKKLTGMNSLLYDVYDDQINILHVTAGGKRVSSRLDYPKKEIVALF